MSVELYASIAKTKITSDATITPRPMYIHHMGHLIERAADQRVV
jgi:hypothetical protein